MLIILNMNYCFKKRCHLKIFPIVTLAFIFQRGRTICTISLVDIIGNTSNCMQYGVVALEEMSFADFLCLSPVVIFFSRVETISGFFFCNSATGQLFLNLGKCSVGVVV